MLINANTAVVSINANPIEVSIDNAAAGSGQPHNNMPPTMTVNFIMRVL